MFERRSWLNRGQIEDKKQTNQNTHKKQTNKKRRQQYILNGTIAELRYNKEITVQETHHVGNATVRTGVPGVQIDLHVVRPRAVSIAHAQAAHTWSSTHDVQRSTKPSYASYCGISYKPGSVEVHT